MKCKNYRTDPFFWGLIMSLLTSVPLFGANTDGNANLGFKELNKQAEQCMAAICSEFGRFGRQHPEFKEIEKRATVIPTPEGYRLHYRLYFNHHTTYRLYMPKVEYAGVAEAGYVAPDDDGVMLNIGIWEGLLQKMEATKRFLVELGDTQIWACYCLKLGKNCKESQDVSNGIIEKHLKEFCDVVKRMK